MARFVAVAQHFWQRLLDGGHRMTSMFPHVSSSFLEKMLSFTTGLLGEPRSDWTSRSQMTQISSNTKPKDPKGSKGSQRPKARRAQGNPRQPKNLKFEVMGRKSTMHVDLHEHFEI